MKVWSLGICGGVLVVAAVFCGCTTNVEDLYQYGIEGRKPREITVRGVAEVVVPPDYVEVHTRVVTLDKDLNKSQAENDEQVKAVLDLVRKMGIAPDDVSTGYTSLGPKEHRVRDQAPVFLGFEATKSITVKLRDLSKYETLISGMLEVGVNRISSVSFRSSEELEKRKQARVLAIKAAREKAEYLAAQLGQKLGQPLWVAEFRRETPGMPGSSNVAYAYAREGEAEPDSEQGTIAPGSITIRAQVEASFELVD